MAAPLVSAAPRSPAAGGWTAGRRAVRHRRRAAGRIGGARAAADASTVPATLGARSPP